MRLNKVILSVISYIVVGSFQIVVWGQTISGKIIDSEQRPIEGVTIVLQTVDSIYIDASISNADGIFTLNGQQEKYRLIIQHLLFHTKQVTGNGKNAGTIQLQPQDYALDEVVVKAERPFVKVENGRLGYNLAVLSEKQVVNNAYEALMRLPGVQESKGVLTLVGAGNLTVILNGKPTTMDVGQLETLLRNTPVNRVEKVEVMYSAPPEYHVRGAVINVVLKRSNDYSFQGEVSADYKNQYFNSGGMKGNFRLSTPKMAFDVMYGANDVKNMEYIDLDSRHALKNERYDISQNEQLRSKYWNHNFRTAFEYNFNDNHTINVIYTGSYSPDQYNSSETTGNYQTSNVDKYLDTRMNNVTLQYHSGFGLEIGGDYTHYKSDNHQSLYADYQDGRQSSFSMVGGQRIDRYSIYADQKHSLSKGWSLGYGVSYRFAKDRDFQIYDKVVGDIHTQNMYSDLKEQTTNFYVSLSKNYETGVSFSVSATGEYYTIGNYHKWAVYPQASLTYFKTPKHTFQFSLSTDKTYPGYWDMQSSVSYLNGYTELWGTPGLKPMTNYNLNGSYILKQKYIFNLFFMLPALCKEQGKKPQQCPLDLQLVAGELGAVGILHLPQAGGGLQIAQIVRGQPRRQRQAPALQRKQIFLGTKVLCAAQKLQLKNDIFVFHALPFGLPQGMEGAGRKNKDVPHAGRAALSAHLHQSCAPLDKDQLHALLPVERHLRKVPRNGAGIQIEGKPHGTMLLGLLQRCLILHCFTSR